MLSFTLDPAFIKEAKTWKNPLDDNVIGNIVYRRTYRRGDETWYSTVERVVNGIGSIQKDHIIEQGLGWDEEKGQRIHQKMYKLIFTMKFLPPGRGLWVIGTDIIHKKNLGMAANNCSFVSTKDFLKDPTRPFTFLMDGSMLGTGVGFDTKGKDLIEVYLPLPEIETWVIPDTREGWVESVERLLRSYFFPRQTVVEFDYSSIRGEGEKLVTFGGISSGSVPLIELHKALRAVLDREATTNKQKLTSTGIVDICNLIGKCVVSGNVRRSALIAFGEPGDKDFLDLKNYEVNPHRASYGWTSNNTIFAELGMDYEDIGKRITLNGEPGLAWLSNMRKYSRMCDEADYKDMKVMGANPCMEQELESYEVCCLVETFPAKHETMEEYIETIDLAYQYAKAVTLLKLHWVESNRVVMRNRRIGCSISGMMRFVGQKGIHEARRWLTTAYDRIQHRDKIYSDWFCVPRSIKTTSVKPSGTVSLLANEPPGVHFPNSTYYIRRIRMGTNDPLTKEMENKGYSVEPCIGCEQTTSVVSIPKFIGDGIKTLDDVTMWQQLEMAAFMQAYWADNQVSCTITFDPETEGKHIGSALQTYQYRLKGISFLPRFDDVYPQLPYQKITKEQYENEVRLVNARHDQRFDNIASTSPPMLSVSDMMPAGVMFCDSEKCEI